MPGILTVDGTAYDQSARKANSLIVDAWCAWDLADDSWLEFHEYCAGYQPRFKGGEEVSFTDASSTLRFTGNIAASQPDMGPQGRDWGYRCTGMKNRADWIPVTGIDGANTMAFNLRLDDEEYLASNAGKSVGDILAAVFTQHATALGAVGIATDSTTAAQLAAMTLVPPDPVYIQGERLWAEVDAFLGQWQRNVCPVILPDGTVRFIDATAGDSHTLTLGDDPVDPPMLSRSSFHCATRLVVRGKGDIYPVAVSLLGGDVQIPWTSPDQAAWTIADFERPGDAYDKGVVTTTSGPTSITIQSSDGATAWATNFWAAREAWIYLKKSSAVGLSYAEQRPITACTAMTAGGTSDLTLGLDLDNSSSTAWDTYEIIGKAGDLADGRNYVYRLLNVVTPGNWVEQHLVVRFPQPVPAVGLNGASAQLVSTPVCMIIYQGGSSVPATFRVIPSTGQILFDRPYVEPINQRSNLEAGGASVVQPDDIVFLLAYSRGALEAVYPPDVAGAPQYAGTAYTVAGLERTRYADVDSWQYRGNQPLMDELAQMLHQAACDIRIEGGVRYRGEYSTVLDVGVGHRLSFAAACGTTGDEALAVPVRAVTVRYGTSGGGSLVTTELTVSNSRDPRTDISKFTHTSRFGSGVDTPSGIEGNYQEANRAAFGDDFGKGNYEASNKAAMERIEADRRQE